MGRPKSVPLPARVERPQTRYDRHWHNRVPWDGEDLRPWLDARWLLCAIAGYTHRHEDTPCGAALRKLSREHARRLPDALDAYEEAIGVLELHGETAAFEAWRRSRDTCAGTWPTRESQEDRQRMRPLLEAQLHKERKLQ